MAMGNWLGWPEGPAGVVDCWLACSSGDRAATNAMEIAWTVEAFSDITASVERTVDFDRGAS